VEMRLSDSWRGAMEGVILAAVPRAVFKQLVLGKWEGKGGNKGNYR
jgi:hypothetical protein